MFETPVLIFLIAWIGLVSPKTLGRYRKHALLGAFIIAAIITPTADPINQAFVGVPMYALFELGVMAARLVHRRKIKRETETSEKQPLQV